MTAQSAWKTFEKSGLVTDYLTYKNALAQEARETENQHTGPDNQGYGDKK